MSEVATRKFGGKKYTLKVRSHTKRAATKYAKGQRASGRSARLTCDKAGGHTNYNVWVR